MVAEVDIITSELLSKLNKQSPDWDELSVDLNFKAHSTLSVKVISKWKHYGLVDERDYHGLANPSQIGEYRLYDDLSALRDERERMLEAVPKQAPPIDTVQGLLSKSPYQHLNKPVRISLGFLGSYKIQVGKQNLLTLEKSSFPVIR